MQEEEMDAIGKAAGFPGGSVAGFLIDQLAPAIEDQKMKWVLRFVADDEGFVGMNEQVPVGETKRIVLAFLGGPPTEKYLNLFNLSGDQTTHYVLTVIE